VTLTIEIDGTREQRDDLQRSERGLAVGAVQQTESEWSRLIAMLELSQRWQELAGEFTGEDGHPARASADDFWSASRSSNNSEGKQMRGLAPERLADALLESLDLIDAASRVGVTGAANERDAA
jgi:hypothetical protein